MARFLWICFAGALGTGVRYAVSTWAAGRLGAYFPYGTLIVNVLGCFLLAAIMQIALSTTLLSPTTRLALATGFMGGLTTYSTFNYETAKLVEEGAGMAAFANFVVTTAGCFCAGLLGLIVGRHLFG